MDHYPDKIASTNTSLSQARKDCATVEPTQHDLILKRLANLTQHFGDNARRTIEIGSRAFGGSPVGADRAGGSASKPQAAGSIGAIESLLNDLQEIASLQSEALSHAERIA